MRLPWRAVTLHDGRTIETSLTQAEADALRDLARGRYVLEVGSAFGYSACVMAPESRHVFAVDPHETHGSLPTMRWNIDPQRVTILLGESQVVLPRLHSLGARFDLAFIDGDHRYAGVTHDLHFASSLSHRIAVHDFGEDTCPDVAPAVRAVLGEPDRLVDTLAVFHV